MCQNREDDLHTRRESGLGCHGHWARMGLEQGAVGLAQPTHCLPICSSLQSIYHRMLGALFEKIEMMEHISIGRKLFFFYGDISIGIILPDSISPIKKYFCLNIRVHEDKKYCP